jgi:hypothetical protein
VLAREIALPSAREGDERKWSGLNKAAKIFETIAELAK